MKNILYEAADKALRELITENISYAQQIFDLKEENSKLSRLLETYKSKSDLIIELTTPIDMHTEENKGLKLVK